MSRPSALPPARGVVPAQTIAARLLDKRQEWEAVTNLDETTSEIVKVLEDLAAEGNIMADGGRAVASVMVNWPNVLRIINLFVQGPASTANTPQVEDPPSTDLARLVRIDTNGLAQN